MFDKFGLLATVMIGAVVLTAGCNSSEQHATLSESNAAEFRQHLDQPGLVLAKFGAPWCPPCREVDRELAKMTVKQKS